MNVDLQTYRARVGGFYSKALSAFRQLSFVNISNVIQFMILIYFQNSNGVRLSVLAHFIISDHCKALDKELNFSSAFGNGEHYAGKENTSAHSARHIGQLHLLLSGDVELNPGPNYDLEIIHININSIRNKIDIFEAEYNAFDIITVSETWLSDSVSNEAIQLTNFHPPVRRDRPGDPHGGVAIYVKNNLFFKPRPDLLVDDLEAVWVETKLDQTSLLIGSFYRPPSSNINYWNLIEESIHKVNNTTQKFIILGDFNNDILTNASPHLLQIMNRYQLTQYIKKPTRITESSQTCLDLILCQCPSIIVSTDVLPAVCSDHSVPYARIKNEVPKNQSFKRIIYNYNKLDIEKFCNLLNLIDWAEIINDRTIDESAELFSRVLLENAKVCMPCKTITVRPYDVPWMTDEIRTLIEERILLHAMAKATNNPDDWRMFRQFRNYVTSKERERKSEYMAELNEKASDHSKFGKKEWWKLVTSFLKRKGIDSNEIPPILSEGITIYNNKDKANAFNRFFISQSTLENENDVVPDVPFLIPELTEISLSTADVEQVITKLNKNKAVGPDQVHNRLLIAALPVILNPLTVIFNKSLNEGKFPTVWKTAHVTPLHKKLSKNTCNNYRPISLLSCVGKVMERCIHKKVYNFLMDNNHISPSQSGFISGDSTVNQLLCIYNDLCHSYDNKIAAQAVFFDISKAFDRVWHKGLITKLEGIGIRGKLLTWFIDYLSNRIQLVTIKGDQSDYLRIPAGVPQGSVLGPLLFLIYINDITNDVQSNVKLFADDTSMSLSDNDAVVRTDIMNSDLQKINSWAEKWKVKFSEEKTELLNFVRGNNTLLPLTFGDTALHSKENHKHLGLILQNNFKWDKHIDSLINKVTMLLSCMKSYKYRLNRKALEIMYKSFILPIFDYADVIWDNCSEQSSNSLENLHLEAIRIIIGAVRGTSHQKLYQESGFCSLKERRRRHKIVYYYKIINGMCPLYLSNLLPPLASEANPYHRRRPLERVVPRCNTEIYRTSFIPSTTNIWNSLPDNLKNSSSLSALKRNLSTDDHIVPPHYYFGNRKEQIIHCRLRISMSDLKNDLHNRHLTDDATCTCGTGLETAEHYLLLCPLFNDVRRNTIHDLPRDFVQIQTLLNGDNNLNINLNTLIFDAVHKFISESGRFSE